MSYEIGDTLYYTATETAKFVRQVFKEKFTGVKFTVRQSGSVNYSGLDVSYMGGPSRDEVEKAVEHLIGTQWSMEYECRVDQFSMRDGRKVHYGLNGIQVKRNNTIDSTIIDVTPLQIEAAK